jgi:hypothetical protein
LHSIPLYWREKKEKKMVGFYSDILPPFARRSAWQKQCKNKKENISGQKNPRQQREKIDQPLACREYNLWPNSTSFMSFVRALFTVPLISFFSHNLPHLDNVPSMTGF